MGDSSNDSKKMQNIIREIGSDKISAMLNAAFSDQKKFDPLIDSKGIPSHCVVIGDGGDICFSVSIGGEMGFGDYGTAKHFCEQHVMDCLNNGMKNAKHWKVRPAFVGK